MVKVKKYHPDDVLKEVCAYYKISKEEILSRNRVHHLVIARHMYMYLCYKYTDWSLAAFCKHIKRDHSTGSYVVKKFNGYLSKDEAEDLKYLDNRFYNREVDPFLMSLNFLGKAFKEINFDMIVGLKKLQKIA